MEQNILYERVRADVYHQFESWDRPSVCQWYDQHAVILLLPSCRVGPIKLVLELETPRYMGFLGNRDSETFHFCQCFAGTHITQAI